VAVPQVVVRVQNTTERKLKLEVENNSANGKYGQRHSPPETQRERFTSCSYIVYSTSLSQYNSRLVLYTICRTPVCRMLHRLKSETGSGFVNKSLSVGKQVLNVSIRCRLVK